MLVDSSTLTGLSTALGDEVAHDQHEKSKTLDAFLEGETFGAGGPPWKLVKPQDFSASNNENCLQHHDGHDVWDSVNELEE